MKTVNKNPIEPSMAGVIFNNKVDVYDFLAKHIKQEIIVTGSTVLVAYGLTTKSDPLDLDLIIHNPTKETEAFLSACYALFPESEHEKSYMKPDKMDFDIGKLTMYRFKGSQGDFKVHIFYKNQKQQTLSYHFGGKVYPLSLPGDIFLAKRKFSRPKDYQQLAEICCNILKGTEATK